MVEVDSDIFLGNDNAQLKQAIQEIQDVGLNIEDQGHPADYAGVGIKKLRDGSYKFTQHALIDAIINNVGISTTQEPSQFQPKFECYIMDNWPHNYQNWI